MDVLYYCSLLLSVRKAAERISMTGHLLHYAGPAGPDGPLRALEGPRRRCCGCGHPEARAGARAAAEKAPDAAV